MNETNNCAFQYATGNGTIKADVSEISKDVAMAMFNSHKVQYKQDLEEGNEPEMVVWINMKDSTSYGDTAEWWNAEDFILRDGVLYQRVD